ncbi:Threonine aldolase [Gonapodya sp. JEL0774]|nr:Threonine aldolase [Gonapodya sp. JEL0774]
MEMFQSMIHASMGDDVYFEDSDTNALEAKVATLFGKEAACFVLTGTMANQLAIRAHISQPPASIVVDARSHVWSWEAGAASYHTGAQMVPVYLPAGSYLDADSIQPFLKDYSNHHVAPTKLICVENTLDGEIVPIANLRSIHGLSRTSNPVIPIHLDGARLWNAHIATGISLADYGKIADSISVCFSKGLGTMMGSCVVGNKDYIDNVRRYRKIFGGAWRQSGPLAAAASYAIDHNLPLLKNDHVTAAYLGSELTSLGFILLKRVDTNMVWIDLASSFKRLGVKISPNDVQKRLWEEEKVKFPVDSARGVGRVVVHGQNHGGVEAILRVLRETISK